MNIETNKIAGAVLGTAVGVMAIMILAEIIFEPPHHQEPGYVIAVAGGEGEGHGGGGGGQPAEEEPIAERLQVASVDDGMNQAKKCLACHTFEDGGPAKVGPNLWNIVGAHAAHAADFGYSEAMQEKAAEGLTWDFDNLDVYLTNPKKFVPGTAMAFAGIKNPAQRADLIAYLRTLSNDPVPIPTATAAAEPAMDEHAAEEPGDGHGDAADMPADDAAPAEDAPAADGEPAADMPAEDAPADDAAGAEPAGDAPDSASEPANDAPAEAEPTADMPDAEPAPATDAPGDDAEPASDAPAETPAPAGDDAMNGGESPAADTRN